MSSSASISGGKYTRDLKLRVLEHYFRNGGDVFGNKQSTAKKFGVDSKTINRFLKIHELVRVARKNAKSNKSAAGSSSGGFKEPLVPGAGGSGRTRPPARQTVRITLPTQPDESIVNQTADGNISSIGKLLKIFELGTQEIRDLLSAECDLIYECRVCRGLFRSVANLLSHKRRFCTRPAVDTRQVFGAGPGQSLAASSDGVLVLPLPAAIDRLPEVRQAAAVEARAAAAQPVPAVRLQPLPGSDAAVFQTVGDAPSVGDQVEEVHRLEEAAGRTVRLGRDGRVLESDAEPEEAEEAEQVDGEDGRHVCQHCNTTFSTRKTLSHHVRSLHSSTRIYYPCCLCSAAFINMFSVERHLQKVHKKKQEEVDVLKEGIKQKSFHRSVTEAQAAAPPANPNMPMKVTSFEWKCRQCNRRYLSLPVGLQHVQSVHPQFSSARAGLVRVCRIIRQPAESGAVSTRSSSGAVTPAELEHSAAPPEDDTETEQTDTSGGRMLFNKANLLKRLASGGERCVLCRKVFTGHLQACGHLRLHDQSQIEAYLGQKVRLIRKRRPMDAPAEQEEYELDEAAAASPPDEDEPEPESEVESLAETPDESAAGSAAEPPASVEARGFPVQMVAAERVRRRHFIHAVPGGEHVCTLCEARFARWPAARAHMARHSRSEVARYVARHAVDGLVGVPASLSLRAARDGEREEEEEEAEGETASVDTDIEAGAKLLVSCKLWSPDKRKRASAADRQRRTGGENAAEDEEEVEEDENEQDTEPLTQELDGETVDKWEAIRRKGSRLRCVVCNKTFMKNSYAEMHLRTDHTFEEVRDFLSNWRFKGIRVPPRSGDPEDAMEEEDVEDEEEASSDVGKEPQTAVPEPASPKASSEAKTGERTPQKGAKRTAESAAPAAPPAKAPKREQTVLNVPKVTPPRDLAPVGPIGPNTKILKISRSDLLQRRDGGLRLCLVCDRQFDTHTAACDHMRHHSDEDIRNFIKTRGREFLPAFEQKSKTYVRRASDGAGSAPSTPTGAPAKPARSLSAGPTDKSGDRTAKSSAVESSKEASGGGDDAEAPAPAPQRFQRDEAVCEFELFDKAQLLKRQPDGTKCLLCTRVFAKHSSACGHLSHHGAAEVQAWRNRMRRKASALLKLARRPRAGGDAARETEPVEGAKSPGEKSAAGMVTSQTDDVAESDGAPPAKAVKQDVPVPARVTRRKDSVPVKVTRADDAVTEKAAKPDQESVPAKAVKGEVSSPVKTVDTESPRPASQTFQVSGGRVIGRLVKTAEPAPAPPAQTSGSPPPAVKPAQDTNQPTKAAVSSPLVQKADESSAQAPTVKAAEDSKPTPEKVTPSKTPPLPPPPAAKANQQVAVARPLVSPAGVSLATGGSTASVRTAQLVKLPQTVKLALLQSADGTLQSAGGRTIMRLAPGVKLPLTAGALPRVLRPIAPKSGAAGAEAVPVPVLQPPLAGAVSSPGGSPRPRPPPLLRAPLLQTMSRAGSGGGSITVHVPALKTTAPQTATTVLATAVSPGARPAVKLVDASSREAAAKSDAKTDTRTDTKTDAKDDKEAETTAAEVRLRDNSPHNRRSGLGETTAPLEVKSEPEKVSAEATKPTKRQSEVKGGQAKPPPQTEAEKRVDPAARTSQRRTPAPAAERVSDRAADATPTAAAKPAVVTKRAFIPEVPAKPVTRCSWTPDPNSKASPRAAEPGNKTSPRAPEPAAPPSGEVPQTRARAEAAIAARMRQTRRSSGAGAERK